MKLSLRPSLSWPLMSCAFLLPVVLGAAACGSEAPLPVLNNNAGQSTGGTGVVATGGSAGSVSTSGGTGVVSMAGTGTTTGGSTPVGGAGGSSSTGGSVSQAGGGAGGAQGGGAQGGSAGSGMSLLDVAAPLDGAMLLGPCLNDTAQSVCATVNGACPPRNQADQTLSGALTTDKMVVLGGDPTKTYTITLHVQGEVESKTYTGGMDQEGQKQSPGADGFCTGGTPTTGDAYNVYMVRVSSPKADYFLNSLNGPGVSNHTTYGIDYTAKIKANGGAMIRLVASDANCAMIKNCGPMENSGNVCSAPIVLQNIDAKAKAKNPSFNFTTAYNGQWIVMVVTDVTAN